MKKVNEDIHNDAINAYTEEDLEYYKNNSPRTYAEIMRKREGAYETPLTGEFTTDELATTTGVIGDSTKKKKNVRQKVANVAKDLKGGNFLSSSKWEKDENEDLVVHYAGDPDPGPYRVEQIGGYRGNMDLQKDENGKLIVDPEQDKFKGLVTALWKHAKWVSIEEPRNQFFDGNKGKPEGCFEDKRIILKEVEQLAPQLMSKVNLPQPKSYGRANVTIYHDTANKEVTMVFRSCCDIYSYVMRTPDDFIPAVYMPHSYNGVPSVIKFGYGGKSFGAEGTTVHADSEFKTMSIPDVENPQEGFLVLNHDWGFFIDANSAEAKIWSKSQEDKKAKDTVE